MEFLNRSHREESDGETELQREEGQREGGGGWGVRRVGGAPSSQPMASHRLQKWQSSWNQLVLFGGGRTGGTRRGGVNPEWGGWWGGGGGGGHQLRRHERHHVMRAEHAGFMGASRMDVRHTRTTQRNVGMAAAAAAVVCCCCCHFPLCSILALERRDSWEAEEESAKRRAWRSVCGRGKQATHRNGI